MSESASSWPDGMDAAERVRHVAMTRTEPQNAGWIADEAAVSRDTAVKYLTRMVERGDLERVETADGDCYRPDGVTQFLREVRQLAEAETLDELTHELEAIADDIDSWKADYEVESLAELRQSLGRADLSYDERRERREVIEEWAYNVEAREAIQLAIRLKHSLSSLETASFSDDPSRTLPQEG
jgi:predicted ArsR family transcriptional regulator